GGSDGRRRGSGLAGSPRTSPSDQRPPDDRRRGCDGQGYDAGHATAVGCALHLRTSHGLGHDDCGHRRVTCPTTPHAATGTDGTASTASDEHTPKSSSKRIAAVVAGKSRACGRAGPRSAGETAGALLATST